MVVLASEEAQHAAKVMRARPGEAVTLFDGHGYESEAVIETIDKRNCVVQAQPAVHVDRESPRQLHLGVALPKPDRAKEMIERLTELGVQRVTPLHCQRTQRAPSDALLGKLRRLVIESSKQCGRNQLMEIAEPLTVAQMVERDDGGRRLLAHPGGGVLSELLGSSDAQVCVLIGPEGGFTDGEVGDAVGGGFELVGLGRRIYRIETAATVIAARLSD